MEVSNKLQEKIEFYATRQSCAENLFTFANHSWRAIEGTPFVSTWHIEAVCEHLMAAIRGEIKTLLISIPPRTSKTSIISIMWPPWVWIKQPHIKFVYSSYSQKISWEHSRLCKLLIESHWYQQYWGSVFVLRKDQATKGHFANDKHGYRIATSVGAGTTALGGDVLVCDDPNETGESQVTRESTNDWISRVWSSRLNPTGLGINVLVQQRTAVMDVSGYWLSRDDSDKIVKLILPMEYENARKTKTIILPSTHGKIWEDPRTVEGELLCPNYIDSQQLEHIKVKLGRHNYSSQYQQLPAPAEGGLIQKKWFQWYKEPKLPKFSFIVQSWDTAFTAKKSASYSACTTWGIFDLNGASNIMLLSAWRGHVMFPDLLKRAARLYNNCFDIGIEVKPKTDSSPPDIVLIESKASGHSLADEFIAKGIPAHRFNPDQYDEKEQRVHKITPYIEAALVWVIAKAPNFLVLRDDHDMVIENCAVFPDPESRDIVDSMTQALLFLTKKRGILKHVMDLDFRREEYMPEEYKPGFKEVPLKQNRGFFSSKEEEQ